MIRNYFYVLDNIKKDDCLKTFEYLIISAYNKKQIKEFVENHPFPYPIRFKSYGDAMDYISKEGRRCECNYFHGDLINLTN